MAAASIVARIVEPDPCTRASLRALLEMVPVRVEDFASAGELLDACSEASRGCVVTEVELPDMCGFTLCQKLRALAPRLAVVMLARNPDVALAVRALRGGAVDFFEKPPDEREFLRRVRQVLERAGDPEPQS